MKTREEKLKYKRDYMKKWNAIHAEKLRDKRKANSEVLAAKSMKWRENNPEKVKDTIKRSREKTREIQSQRRKLYREANIDAVRMSSRIYNKKWSRQNPVSVMITSAKRRAKKSNIPFSITKKDVIIPEFCPILGIQIVQGDGFGPCDSSPSIDRIIPSKGYVPENIAVISFRANRIKNEGTAEEHQKIVDWIKSHE